MKVKQYSNPPDNQDFIPIETKVAYMEHNPEEGCMMGDAFPGTVGYNKQTQLITITIPELLISVGISLDAIIKSVESSSGK